MQQVDAILELRLQKLTALGINEIEIEIKNFQNLFRVIKRLYLQKRNY